MSSELCLTQEIVQNLFIYDPKTGVLTWRERPESDFASTRYARWWNKSYAGREAGFSGGGGYRQISIKQYNVKNIYTHRIIWLWVTGEWLKWPDWEIDHINHNKGDNRWDNLRKVKYIENKRNYPLLKSNTSGFMGVFFRKNSPRTPWMARITYNGKVILLGSFATKEEAIAARQAANYKYGFHENHGAAA